ncbi:energy-coupling factor transporter ATPase [Halalkalibacillus sediminis]|uniref:Energy-coupling factor transporter ATP-binding protein EcfA2 n=1 Tax=Halalkalibacillus sediminis TaxID=2018042 RepID=A0A2I0QQF7_9BACI|nr:energy-coupling factor transporter ATPase [Halalkalibacillus sediminis]PKR76566.1 energy-coupling factor transporter ATPase [Halalkalibacillus sediminis]
MDISFEQVNYIYQPNSPMAHQALKDINFQVSSGSFTAIVGHTGSGKSTLIQHLNGLMRPTSGKIRIGDYELSHEKSKEMKKLRKEVGMVFQYPEHQLFEETVKKDILFGPKNFGMEDYELDEVIDQVGLDSSILDKSPFELSGGQMRRVAIAGVLIMKPSILVLDEPTAGLDPLGRSQMMDLFSTLHKTYGQTIVLVTHHMEDALHYADQMIVMNQSEIALKGDPIELFKKRDKLKGLGLALPEVIQLIDQVNEKFQTHIEYNGQSQSELAEEIGQVVKDGADT